MYHFQLAGPEDDAALRHLLAATPMPGPISLALCREPSYFAAARVEGRFHQTLAARDNAHRIVATGARSITPRFLNGQPRDLGYLSSLRILPDHRNHRILFRGYDFLRQLHADARTPAYLTTIAATNTPALALLTSARAGLPAYHLLGDYFTAAIPLTTRWRPHRDPNFLIRPATLPDAPQILDFLRRVGPTRQFFPAYELPDLFTATGLLPGLAPEDLLLAFQGPRLVGTLAAWNQNAFRQTRITAYAQPLRTLRPLYNLLAPSLGRPRLPAPASDLRVLTCALPLAEDPAILATLLAVLLDKLKAVGGADYLLLGLAATDPLRAALHRAPARHYITRLFCVCWPDGEFLRRSFDPRPFYLELGSL